jgi:Rrf2 family cysteine metabolism transcriptional repressor
VKAVRGPGRGHALARDAATICVGEILRAAEGPITPSECVPTGKSTCPRAPGCRVRPLWECLTTGITSVLDNTSLADLCNSEPIRMRADTHIENTAELVKEQTNERN